MPSDQFGKRDLRPLLDERRQQVRFRNMRYTRHPLYPRDQSEVAGNPITLLRREQPIG